MIPSVPVEVLAFAHGARAVARVYVISGPRSYAIEADGADADDALAALGVALADASARIALARSPDACPGCRRPVHASESDDEGRCARCAESAGEPHAPVEARQRAR